MIEFKTGDILAADAEALVNTVNCVGVMGRGIALQFKKAFKENFNAYAAACAEGQVRPGKMFVVDTHRLTGPRWIINFPTKRHWRAGSRLEDIDSGLDDLVRVIEERGIRSIAIPPLGCGLGGLNWSDVRPRIVAAVDRVPGLETTIFEPGGRPSTSVSESKRPRMTNGRAALIALFDRYLGGLMDPFVTLLELHKLLYFAQESGLALRLKYQKGPFGPYSENLRHVLNKIEGHFVQGYDDGGDAPHKQLHLLDGALDQARAQIVDDEATNRHLQRVSELVDGFESPFGLELLSTVHWVCSRETVASLPAIEDRVYGWNERKRRFTPRQIKVAAEVLVQQGWISAFME